MSGPGRVYPVPHHVASAAWIDAARYQAEYARSLADPEGYWAEQAERFVTWITPWQRVMDCDLAAGHLRWFDGGQLNVAANCVDRHLAEHGETLALLWEGDSPGETRTFTYRELHLAVCRCANVLKARGVVKGDRVAIYLPMVPEAVVAMLACARIGAIHSVVFAGFSPEALKDRILDSDCRVLITADRGLRGGRRVPLKANADQALRHCPEVHTVLVVRRTGEEIGWQEGRDFWYHLLVDAASADCPPEPMAAEDPLFILYTSGSTGHPKGVLHTSGGYLVYAAMTHRYCFDYRPGEVYWCTADVGWITGHSYVVYGPLCNGATVLLYEGVPTHPDPSRLWRIVDEWRVNILYTAPTLLRSLMGLGDDWVRRAGREGLRILASVGEPINPEAWEWYHRVVGEGRCPVVDTWWQTETGGICISPLPGATALKPGAACRPFFGIEPALLDGEGQEIQGAGSGALVLKRPWPGQMRTVFGDHERFLSAYLRAYPGYYQTGDGARRDEDGDYWLTGRIDDVLNVSGHRLGTAEIEGALVLHEAVAEAAVVGDAHPIKGQGIYAFVTLMHGVRPSEALREELVRHVRTEIGPIATPDWIQWAPALPKTRSGKIMRRILRRVAAAEFDSLGDISTLADPAVVEDLIQHRIAH